MYLMEVCCINGGALMCRYVKVCVLAKWRVCEGVYCVEMLCLENCITSLKSSAEA